jgi:hypothetical protein
VTVDVEAVSQEGNKDLRFDPLDHLMVDRAHFQIVACPRTFIQRRLESRLCLRHEARVEQHAIGGAGRGCAAGRMLR